MILRRAAGLRCDTVSRRGGAAAYLAAFCPFCGDSPALAGMGRGNGRIRPGVRGPPAPQDGAGGPRTPFGGGGSGAGISANRDVTGIASRRRKLRLFRNTHQDGDDGPSMTLGQASTSTMPPARLSGTSPAERKPDATPGPHRTGWE